jgi:hypothetical protein
MTNPAPRTAGKCGRRPPKRAPALRLGPLLTGAVPQHPAAADYLAALGGGWQMLGNNVAGDCVAVTYANVRRLVTTALTASGYYPSQDEVWAVYKTQNPDFDPDGSPDVNGPGSPADGGMDVQTLLEYLTRTGGPDGVKAVAFAAVNPEDPDEVKAAIAIFGYVWAGVTVAANNQQEFSAGQPWDYDPASAAEGGHSVIVGGYGTPGAGPLGGDERFITWAAETSFTDAFWANSVEECFAVIWPEHLGTREFLQGVNVTQLAADYKAITGRALPAPAPAANGASTMNTPAPVPTPAPAPAVPASRPGFVGWFEEHVVPGFRDLEADAEKARAVIPEIEAYLPKILAAAKADPAVGQALAGLIPDAERILALIQAL